MRKAPFNTTVLPPRKLGYVFAWMTAFLLVLLFVAPAFAQPKASGLPLPRFVSLRSGEVNLRAGPGVRYPIAWIYHVKGLPVEVTAEYDTWRRVKDVSGEEGWVHLSVLSGRRMGLINVDKASVYRDPTDTSAIVAMAERNVLTRLMACKIAWCKIDAAGFRGWAKKQDLWGVYPDEVFE